MEEKKKIPPSSSGCHPTTPSSSLTPQVRRTQFPSPLTPLLPRNRQEFCKDEKDLPSKCISQLWNQPLKYSVVSPSDAASNKQIRNHPTPTRSAFRSVISIPPTKLFGKDSDDSPSLVHRSVYRRSLSHPEPYGAVTAVNPKRQKLFDNSNEEISPYEEYNTKNKSKSKASSGNENTSNESHTTLTPAVKKLFVKSHSDTSIISALEKIESNPNLIGDATMDYVLPVMSDDENKDHPGLKKITGDTLANLLQRKEDFPQLTFTIIDCRYPYEFEAGHIRGAVNYYTKAQVKEFLDAKTLLRSPSSAKSVNMVEGTAGGTSREILIFHCEFSSRRGPALCRYLRDIDRKVNQSSYPFLSYPELYLLNGGYKAFFENYPNLCEPRAYVEMTDPKHKLAYQKYKSKSKLVGCEKGC